MASMARHVETLLAWQARGSIVFDYGNNLRQRAFDAGVHNAFAYPGFVPAYIRPLFCTGKGPFRWVALSGDPADIYATDRAVMELFPDNEHLVRWLQMAGEGRLSRSPGAHLLARLWGARQGRIEIQRHGGTGSRESTHCHWP